jgi:hypothetical protein
VPNKKARDLLKRVETEGWNPLDLMLHVMREHAAAGRWDQAADLAKNIAPYVHPKLAAVQHSGDESVERLEPPEIHVHFVDPPNRDDEDDVSRPMEPERMCRELPEGSE